METSVAGLAGRNFAGDPGEQYEVEKSQGLLQLDSAPVVKHVLHQTSPYAEVRSANWGAREACPVPAKNVRPAGLVSNINNTYAPQQLYRGSIGEPERDLATREVQKPPDRLEADFYLGSLSRNRR